MSLPTAATRKISPELMSGGLLMGAAALALILSNSPLASAYFAFFQTPIAFGFGEASLEKPLLLWINDGLMAIFFLLVGLEVKREVMDGELSSPSKASLPLLAAVGGMLGPIMIFLFVNAGAQESLRGWAVPAATDIAFALGVLALLGSRVPVALKVLLLSIAVIDDVGAITIIALFYTENLAIQPLGLALFALIGLAVMNLTGVKRLTPYLILASLLWFLVLKSGVHATLAGVAAAAFIPLRGRDENHSPLLTLEHAIQPFTAMAILPIFAFANSGVMLGGMDASAFLSPLTLGIAAGLFFGKQIGVFGAVVLGSVLRIAKRPEGVSYLQLYGLACLTGIGFTMSLFIGGLAFADPALMDQVRVGVLSGSIASGLVGASVLAWSIRKREASAPSRAAEARSEAPISAE